MKNMRPTARKYECFGGPLCGKRQAAIKNDVGIPCFAYDDNEGVSHFYRLARSKGYRYWHYLGTKGIDGQVRPFIRPAPADD